MDFAPSRDGRILAASMAGTVVILIFRSFVFENDFVEIFKESRGTVGWALLRDRVLADQIMAGTRICFASCSENTCSPNFQRESRHGGMGAAPGPRQLELPSQQRQKKPSRADRRSANPSTDRPALYTLTPDRPPLAACNWYYDIMIL